MNVELEEKTNSHSLERLAPHFRYLAHLVRSRLHRNNVLRLAPSGAARTERTGDTCQVICALYISCSSYMFKNYGYETCKKKVELEAMTCIGERASAGVFGRREGT